MTTTPLITTKEPDPGLPAISLGREVLTDFEKASRIEWLETNGTGGYAMGTVAALNTRRYHGLLVAPLHPPAQRHVILAKLEESVTLQGPSAKDNHTHDLSTNQYPGAVHPRGFERLLEFKLDPFPTWTFDLDPPATAAPPRDGAPPSLSRPPPEPIRLEKRLFLVQGEPTVIIQYRVNHACRLHIQPLLAFRDYHSLTQQNPVLDPSVWEEQVPEDQRHIPGRTRVVHVRPYGSLPALRIAFNGEPLEEDGCWNNAVEYLRELDRGQEFREDLYRIGTIEIDLQPGGVGFIVASVLEGGGHFTVDSIAALEAAERARRAPEYADPLVARLARAADQFIVHREDQSLTVLAGYPWFTDWGRDTMISLRGLLIDRGHLEEAASVIEAFLSYLNGGLIPNRLLDHEGDVVEYNTVDATLWLFQAVRAYLAAGGSEELLRRVVYPAAREILACHERGTHYGIRVDATDGLLIAGDAGTQLTWMDARVDGHVVTPRHGKPVEVNALYHGALVLTAEWARRVGEADVAATYEATAARVARSFEEKFWNEERGCLFDVLLPTSEGGWYGDGKIRPNQVLAISLPNVPLPLDKRRRILEVVERELLTPKGLRTLARGDDGYQASYSGDAAKRDSAYHQGLVWPWLLGPFIRALLAVHGRSPATIARCRGMLAGVAEHITTEACLGTVSELFEAEPPFRPDGAPAQAWSVAELLAISLSELGPHTALPKPELPPVSGPISYVELPSV